MSVADKMADQFVPEVDPNPAEPRMVIWSTLRCLELQIDQHEELYDSHGVVSWELLKHMVRLAKRHAYEEGNKIEAAERETDQWRTRADEANAKLRETEQELQRLRQRHVEVKSEELTEARATIADLQQQLDAAHSDFALAEAGTLRHQLDAANAAVTLQRAGIERLQAFFERVRCEAHEDPELYIPFARLVLQFNAGSIEPAPCQGCERLRAELADEEKCRQLQVAEIERLDAFVSKVRAIVDREYDGREFEDIANALAELDADTQPAPVTEPLDDSTGADGPGQS